MKDIFKIKGFNYYIIIIFLNAMTDFGSQNYITKYIFKVYSGDELIILTAIVNALILLPFILLFNPCVDF